MTARRFVASTAREALERVKTELGPDAVILRNRRVDGGVEILAIPESGLGEPGVLPPDAPSEASGMSAPGGTPRATVPLPEAPMSTVSFGRYVNERRSRSQGGTSPGAAGEAAPSPAPAEMASSLAEEPSSAASAKEAPARHASPRPASGYESLTIPGAGVTDDTVLVRELRAMRGYLREQFESMAWVDSVRRSPVQVHLLTRMIDAGFSTRLARALVARVPADYGDDEALVWLHASLARNLECASGADNVLAEGGVFALVGPTGVGKTTTAAKIAAHCALRHGVDSVGLVTVDGYRIGAHEQLRSFGRLIGIPVHVARDAAALGDALGLLARKRLVLIDTAGLGQRDARVSEVLDSLHAGAVQRVTVINAASQAETIDEVIEAYRATEGAGVILSKVDETARPGGAIDSLLRGRLLLLGVADGQRVPEDWHLPDAAALVARALDARPSAARRMSERELALLMSRIEPAAMGSSDTLEAARV